MCTAFAEAGEKVQAKRKAGVQQIFFYPMVTHEVKENKGGVSGEGR